MLGDNSVINNNHLGEIVLHLYDTKEVIVSREFARKMYEYSTSVIQFKNRIFMLVPVTWEMNTNNIHIDTTEEYINNMKNPEPITVYKKGMSKTIRSKLINKEEKTIDTTEVIKVTDLVFDIDLNSQEVYVSQSFYFIENLIKMGRRSGIDYKNDLIVIRGNPLDFYHELVVVAEQKQADIDFVLWK
jgi:hypothetical protein